jgi:hypothetical protein
MKSFKFNQKGQAFSAESGPGGPSENLPGQGPASEPDSEIQPPVGAGEPPSAPSAPADNPVQPAPAASPAVDKGETSASKSLEPDQAGEPALPASPISEVEAPRHSWFYRFLNFLLGPNTRVGRIMRPFLRWAAAITGLFALGLLAGYLLLFQPTQQGLDGANAQVSLQKAEVTRLQGEITVLQNSVVAANKANQAAQEGLAKAQARNNLLVLIYDVANARYYLALKDGAKVMTAIDQARTDLDTLLPYLAASKKDLADELNGRLETVRSVLVRDSQQAQVDLDSLYNALLAANGLLFGN